MASRLFARRQQEKKKATTLVSKQSLEQAVQEGRVLVEQLMSSNAHDTRLDQLQEVISFLESILKKSSMEMQQDGAATLDDYLDDAVMPEMAQKIKQDVDMIAKMKNAAPNTGSPVQASGSDNWVDDRDENGKPKTPEVVEVPRVAATKKAAPAAAPVAPKPSADITQLSSDTLAKMQKALAGSEDLMNDKAAQAFIAAIAEELMNRPVEVEQPEAPAAPAAAAPAPAAPAPVPVAASFGGLALVASEGDDEETSKVAVAPEGWEGTVKEMKKDKDIDNPWALSWWMDDKGYTSHKGSVLLKQVGGRQLVAAMNRDLQTKFANAQGGSWFVSQKGEGLQVEENGGRTPEIGEAHSKQDDNTGIKRPETTDISKFAAGDMTSGKALKLVEKSSDELKRLYFDAKPVTEVLDSRPVREAVEAIYRAYDLMGEAAKVLNKLKIQEDAEEKALEVKEKNKKSSLLGGLTLVGEE